MLNGQPQTYDGNLQVQIVLSLAAWQNVLTMLTNMPWKDANPLIVELQRQIGVALEHATPVPQPGTELRQ